MAESFGAGHPVILVVDNDDLNRGIALRTASRWQNTVEILAMDEAEAIDLVTGGLRPHLAIVSWSTRGGHGAEIVKAIRGRATQFEVPILAATDSLDRAEVQTAYDTGANGVVRKPLGPEEGERFWGAVISYWVDLNLVVNP